MPPRTVNDSRTILDALEDVLGARPVRRELAQLDLTELDEIATHLNRFWLLQSDKVVEGAASLVGGWRAAYASEPSFREDLSDSLLYYSKVLLLDPLADFFSDRSALPALRGIRYRRRDGAYNILQTGPQLWSQAGSFESLRDYPELAADRFAAIVHNLYEIEGLVREGVVELRSQWPILSRRRYQLETAVRHDVGSAELQDLIRSLSTDDAIGPTVWDNIQGLAVSLDDPIRPADEKWRAEPFFYYLGKTLAIADAYGAQYVPSSSPDLELLRNKISSGIQFSHPSAMLREVSRLTVPSMHVSVRQAVAIRKSSDNFEDWRRSLRKIQRDGSADSPEELRQRIEDELLPRVHKVQRDVEGSSIKDLVRTDGADLVIDGTIGFSVAMATNEPAWGAAAALGSGVLQWVRKAYSRPQPSGADAVLATLLRDQQ